MGSLSVRNIDDETLSRLRIQAAKHGVSMEEEVRQIIKTSVSAQERLGDFAVGLFNSCYGGEVLNIPKRTIAKPLKF